MTGTTEIMATSEDLDTLFNFLTRSFKLKGDTVTVTMNLHHWSWLMWCLGTAQTLAEHIDARYERERGG